jgi:hypothetical protein
MKHRVNKSASCSLSEVERDENDFKQIPSLKGL